MHGLVQRSLKTVVLIAALATLWEQAAMGATITVPGDQPTIQAAVNWAAPGDEIVLSDGIYNEAVNLFLMGSVSGAGHGNLTIRANLPGHSTINGNGKSAISAFNFSGDVIIQDINFDADPGVDAVLETENVGGAVVLINNVFLSGYGGKAVDLKITGGINTSRVELRGNSFYSPFDDADCVNISIIGNPIVDLIVEGNYFEAIQTGAIKAALSSSSGLNGPVIAARITNNILKDVLQNGNAIEIDLGDSTTFGAKASLLIDGNEIYNAGADYLDKSISLLLDGTDVTSNIIIRGNTIDGSAGTGIYIGGQDGAANTTTNILVVSNEITNSQYNGIEIQSPRNLNGEPINQNVVCKNNNVLNPYGFGFFFAAYYTLSNYTLNLDLSYNQVENSTHGGYALYLVDENNLVDGNSANVAQGVSSSTVLSEIIADNGNVGNLAYEIGNISVLPNAVKSNQIPASLGGIIWNDLNGNGNQDDGETAMPGIPVSVNGTEYLGGVVDWAAASDTNGIYMIPALLPGDYIVSVAPPLAPAAYVLSPNFADPTGSEPNAIYDPVSGSTTISFTIDRLSLDAGLWIPDPDKIDDDEDGFSEEAGDCNDNDAAISPEGVEICGDGIDQNCDGADLLCPEDIDDDRDGLTENEGDCDDTDATVYPGADEICGDDIDQNCDGSDEVCEVDTASTLSDLQLMVMELKTAKRNKNRLNHYLQKAQRAFDKGHVKQGRKRIVKFMKKLVKQSNYKRFRRNNIAREDADKLIMAAAETLTGQPAGNTYSIADIGSMVAELKTRYRTKASLSYRLFAADWAARLGFYRFSRNLLISFIDKAVNCCDYRGRKASHRITIEESNQLIMAGASALTNLSWR